MTNFVQRLRYAMSIRNKKQTDLSQETGINKAKISSYVNGKYQPKQDGYYLIAKALNVRLEWLMGQDVPMEIQEESTQYPNEMISYNGSSDPKKAELIELLSNNNIPDDKLSLIKSIVESYIEK